MEPVIRPSGATALGGELRDTSGLVAHEPGRATLLGAAVLFVAVAAGGVTWAKWYPYAGKLGKLLVARRWSGSSILATGHAAPGSPPSWHSAWSFTVAYGEDIWVALLAAIVIAAAMEALIPRRRVVAALSRRSTTCGTIVAALVALPTMMCTCCSAPLTVTLKRSGVPTSSALGFWLGNPVLNPAVLAFLALVGPWQWVVTRGLIGVAFVFAAPVVATRIADGSSRAVPSATPPERPVPAESFDLGQAPRRFATAVGRLVLTLVPEYFVVVLLLGAFRGWLMPLGAQSVHAGVLAVLVAAIAGVLIVIPTAGEIPVLVGLAAVGVGPAVLGALLIALPAVSLPSMAMVGRALGWRVVAATAGCAALFGILGGLVLQALA